MRLAGYLAQGQYATALRFYREGRASGVPQDELDRWLVLSSVTPLPNFGDDSAEAAAVRRLRTTRDDPLVARWLAARWYTRGNREDAVDATQDLRRLVRPAGQASPLELSLLDDLSAWDRLAVGDTAGALATWRRATQRFSIEQVPFALVASLWPLRVARVRVASLAGRPRESLETSSTFVRITAFVDQAIWPQAMTLRAEAALAGGDTVLAVTGYQKLVELLSAADGAGIEVRERAVRALEDLRDRRQLRR
jgi:hypothetical protein